MWLLLLIGTVCAGPFILPGTAREYQDGQKVPVDVNVLRSVNTHLPYEYYSLPFCAPSIGYKKEETENLGEILLGDRIRKSPYTDLIKMNINEPCHVVCKPIPVEEKYRTAFRDRIKDDYYVDILLDSLPVAVHNTETQGFSVGFPLGYREGDDYYINNHLEFTAKFHPITTTVKDEEHSAKRIVAFNVIPHSVHHSLGEGNAMVTSCTEKFDPTQFKPHNINETHLVLSYSIRWEESPDAWATRWDVYLTSDTEIHWFSIVNSLMIVLFLSGMVAVIMMSILRRDIANYNKTDQEELKEETGWKLVHADVFREPSHSSMLAIYVGTGVQLMCMSVTVLIFACLGFLSPANRGALFTTMLLCFTFLGLYAGLTTARLMKMWNKMSWKIMFWTATLIPGEIFLTFFIINLFIWHMRSSAAVPFTGMLMLVALWLGIDVPLVYIGGVFGYKKAPIQLPVRVNHVARHIISPKWYLQPVFTVLMGGILPFGAVFIEVFFILTSIWLNRYYYVFGFLFIVFIILVITCAEITIVLIYFQLCAEDYRWWWRSFFTSGSSGLYLFLYSIFYFFTSGAKMKKFVPILIFFGYMGIISYIFCIMTGTIGFLACLFFVKKIYGSIKVD